MTRAPGFRGAEELLGPQHGLGRGTKTAPSVAAGLLVGRAVSQTRGQGKKKGSVTHTVCGLWLGRGLGSGTGCVSHRH